MILKRFKNRWNIIQEEEVERNAIHWRETTHKHLFVQAWF